MTRHNMTDYDREFEQFKRQIHEYYNFSEDVVDKWADDLDKLAMVWVDDSGNKQELTFFHFSRMSKRLANVFSDHQVKKGDVVMVLLGRNIEWWEIFTAALRAGIVKDIPMYSIFKAVAPFFIPIVISIALIILFPEITTWLPGMMFQLR